MKNSFYFKDFTRFRFESTFVLSVPSRQETRNKNRHRLKATTVMKFAAPPDRPCRGFWDGCAGAAGRNGVAEPGDAACTTFRGH